MHMWTWGVLVHGRCTQAGAHSCAVGDERGRAPAPHTVCLLLNSVQWFQWEEWPDSQRKSFPFPWLPTGITHNPWTRKSTQNCQAH